MDVYCAHLTHTPCTTSVSTSCVLSVCADSSFHGRSARVRGMESNVPAGGVVRIARGGGGLVLCCYEAVFATRQAATTLHSFTAATIVGSGSMLGHNNCSVGPHNTHDRKLAVKSLRKTSKPSFSTTTTQTRQDTLTASVRTARFVGTFQRERRRERERERERERVGRGRCGVVGCGWWGG